MQKYIPFSLHVRQPKSLNRIYLLEHFNAIRGKEFTSDMSNGGRLKLL
jgi:hypothetical protein